MSYSVGVGKCRNCPNFHKVGNAVTLTAGRQGNCGSVVRAVRGIVTGPLASFIAVAVYIHTPYMVVLLKN